MQQVSFFCSNCKKSLHLTYEPEGASEKVVMEGVGISCKNCKRVIRFKGYTEGGLLEKAKGIKIYL